MKLNFWQWVGVVLLLVGLAWWQFGSRQAAKSTAPSGNAATTPTTMP